MTNRHTLLSAVALAAALTACGGTSEPRIHDRPAFGYRLAIPDRWVVFGEVIKSRDNSQLSFQVHSLENAERQFMADFPDSLIPQLEQWSKTSFGVIGEPVRTTTAVGGVEALEIVYPVSARVGVEPGRLIYWVARKGGWVFILRVSIPAGAPASDEADARRMAAEIELFEPTE